VCYWQAGRKRWAQSSDTWLRAQLARREEEHNRPDPRVPHNKKARSATRGRAGRIVVWAPAGVGAKCPSRLGSSNNGVTKARVTRQTKILLVAKSMMVMRPKKGGESGRLNLTASGRLSLPFWSAKNWRFPPLLSAKEKLHRSFQSRKAMAQLTAGRQKACRPEAARVLQGGLRVDGSAAELAQAAGQGGKKAEQRQQSKRHTSV
jgi:hypothetical protein